MEDNFHSVFMKQIQNKLKCKYYSYLAIMIFGQLKLILKNSVKNTRTIRIVFLPQECSAKFYIVIYKNRKPKCKLIMKIKKLL